MTLYGEKPKQTNEELLSQIETFLSTFLQFSSHLERARLDVSQWAEQVPISSLLSLSSDVWWWWMVSPSQESNRRKRVQVMRNVATAPHSSITPVSPPVSSDLNLFELHKQEQSRCQPDAVANRLLIKSLEMLRTSESPPAPPDLLSVLIT
jgi:hypothetical protein